MSPHSLQQLAPLDQTWSACAQSPALSASCRRLAIARTSSRPADACNATIPGRDSGSGAGLPL
eukprot:scaffold16329_cov121-Isochrysis_galbana.AAC.7